MASGNITAILEAVIGRLKVTSAVTAIIGERIYQAWPQGRAVFPLAIVWRAVDAPSRFDQRAVTFRHPSIPIELAGYDPDELDDLETKIESVLDGGAFTVSGFRDVGMHVVAVSTDERDFEGKKLHRRVLTLSVDAQPG